MVSIYLSLRFQIHEDSLRESVIFKREDFNLPVTWRVPIYLKDDFSLPDKREDVNLPVTWRVSIYLKDDFSLPGSVPSEKINLPVRAWEIETYITLGGRVVTPPPKVTKFQFTPTSKSTQSRSIYCGFVGSVLHDHPR